MQLGFSVPIHLIDSNLENSFLEDLKKDIYLLRKNDSGANISNNQGWHSTPDLFKKKKRHLKKSVPLVLHQLHPL